MTTALIDTTIFIELQNSAGADFVAELVDTFEQDLPLMLAEMRAAQQDKSTERFRRAAHSIKSNASIFGATQLASMARALELGNLITDLAPIDALDAEQRRVVAALKELSRG